MPLTRKLVFTQTLIGLVSEATGIPEDNVFTHLSLKEQGVEQSITHLLLLIYINDAFDTNITFHHCHTTYSIVDWVELLMCEKQTSEQVGDAVAEAHHAYPITSDR